MISLACPNKLYKNSQLVSNVLEKKKLLNLGDDSHKKIKTALVLEGGVFLGSYGGGVAWGMQDAGLSEVFDYVIGVSTGSVTGAYLLSGQMSLGAPIFYEDLVDGKFLNFRRLNKIIDLEYLIDIFETKKRLDSEKVVQARSNLLIPVTNLRTGQGEVFSVKEEGIDTITLIKAAMSLPGLYKTNTQIMGNTYCDGIYGFTNPVSYAAEELGCTDIVVVTNRACGDKDEPKHLSRLEQLSARTLLRKLSPEFRNTYIARRKGNTRDKELLWGQSKRSNVGLICRDSMPIGRFSQDGNKIKTVVEEARQQAADLFS